VEAATIPDEILLPIDASFVQEVQLSVQDSLACSKHALLDSNTGQHMVVALDTKL
jgi:hypothetical protein